MGRNYGRPGEGKPGAELTDMQASEWRGINSDLVKRLTVYVEASSPKKLVTDVIGLRDQLHADYRSAEAELHVLQRELISASENGDFIKAAVVSRDLVVLKARVQATQAAYHELDVVLKRSKVNAPPIELSHDTVIEEELDICALEQQATSPQLAKVIPLRKFGNP